jgi:EpsI family protein
MKRVTLWAPAAVLLLGSALALRPAERQPPALRTPLAAALPGSFDSHPGQDVRLTADETRIAGMTEYVMRVYQPTGVKSAAGFSLFVGYYASQTHGRTIHSPKNCLPGAGWESLATRLQAIEAPSGRFLVNRTLIQQGQQRALVLYWYQGRGRTEANEYRVKWDLLRDATLRGRSDEALVRVLVPVTGTEQEAFQTAGRVAAAAVVAVQRALPS